MVKTVRLCDGTTTTLSVRSSGPRGVLTRERQGLRLYLYHDKHGTYYKVPTLFTEADAPALEEKIQRQRLCSA